MFTFPPPPPKKNEKKVKIIKLPSILIVSLILKLRTKFSTYGLLQVVNH